MSSIVSRNPELSCPLYLETRPLRSKSLNTNWTIMTNREMLDTHSVPLNRAPLKLKFCRSQHFMNSCTLQNTIEKTLFTNSLP